MTIISKRRLLFLTGCVCLASATILAQTETGNKGFLSFSVKVAEENSPLFSSPGEENSYMTGRLKAGEILEVCFRTDDGWCAVRPPEGSFSWINADYVLRDDSGSGTVVCPDSSKEVPVRVGAASILNSSDVQVGLENGRQVRILGEQTLTGNKTWLKIAPPRGEFRWIRQSSLEQDEFLSQIPRRLTRYEELIAENNSGSSDSENGLEINPETFSRLDEERLDPNIPQTADLTDPIRKVSFDNTFNKELALLYRDLFAAIESSGSDQTFDHLIRRGAALASMASDENQRAEAQMLNDQILARRRSQSFSGTGSQSVGFSGPVEAQSVSPSFSGKPSNDSEQVLFTLPQSHSASSQPQMMPGGDRHLNEKQTNKVRFAFSARGDKSPSNSRSEKRGIFSGKPSTIVPPANYTYPVPAQLKISVPAQTEPVRTSLENTVPPGSQPVPQDQTDDSKVFLAHGQTDQEIRQVSALFVKPEVPGASAPLSHAPDAKNQISSPMPRPSMTMSSDYPGGDISGVLGYLPNSGVGEPSYALISQNGNQNSILCYVVPQQGKSLDPYVGKKIAIKGSRGWFKKGEENRKMIIAESIRIY